MNTLVYEIFAAVWDMAQAMAPYLLLGFLVAGILSVFLSPAMIERHLGRGGLWQIVKASLLGAPLPLCSCGVLPVGLSLRRNGASRGTTIGFIATTPQTSVSSILATYSLLGGLITVIRFGMALISGILSGWAVELFYRHRPDSNGFPENADASDNAPGKPRPSAARRIWNHGFKTLPRDIARPLLVGILISGLLTALAPEGLIADYIHSPAGMRFGILALSIPLYVCSISSIPLAVALIHLGITPGAALILLVAGPATNAATIALVWSRIGKMASVLYIGIIGGFSMLAGWMVDVFVPDAMNYATRVHSHASMNSWWTSAAAVLMLLLVAPGLFPRKNS